MSATFLAHPNSVAAWRIARGWPQEELARRIGVSRAGVGAIETGRVVPSVATALRLAEVFECSVEELFAPREPGGPSWSGSPAREGERAWVLGSSLGRRLMRTEATAVGELPHDGVIEDGVLRARGTVDRRPTLVVAGCDPAAGLLADAVGSRGVRVIPLQRSSGEALDLLGEGAVDVAGAHLSDPSGAPENARVVHERLGAGFRLAHLARWREGVAVPHQDRPLSVGSLMRGRRTWVAREQGSGARVCLDRLFREAGREPRFRRVVHDHRTTAGLIRAGWAQAGVCVELVAAEAGLDFVPAQTESYDLCYPASLERDPRIVALLAALRDRSFRVLVDDLPGYDASRMGEVHDVS